MPLLTTHQLILSKAQSTKMQKDELLRFLAPLLRSGFPLLKSVIKPLDMLGLTASASATDAAINKKKTWIWKSYYINNLCKIF